MLKRIPSLILTFLLVCLTIPAFATDGDWELISNEDGFITQRKGISGSNIFAFRGETIAEVSIGSLLSVFLDASTRKDWVDMFGGSNELIVKSPMDRTYWIRFNTPMPTSDRDYVLHAVGNADHQARTFTTDIESVNHADKPEQDCCVRGQAFRTFYRFQAIPGTNKTKVEVEVHTDPKGWIPNWLTNLIQRKWPKKTLGSLIAQAQKPNVAVHPDYAGWHEVALSSQPEPETADEAASLSAE